MAKRSLNIPRVWEITEPHPDIFSGELDPGRFVISLHKVVTGEGDKDYTDPERFFKKTYMTRSLHTLLRGVIQRLTGSEQAASIRHLQTPFGGGKTHTLTALYHLGRHPEVAEVYLRDLLEEIEAPSLPHDTKVAVLDGVALSLSGRATNEGLRINTLWGEIAYQLGGKTFFEKIRDSDEGRYSPGSEVLSDILKEARPCIILIDEFLAYLIRAQAISIGGGTLADQSLTFLQELATAVAGTERTVLVATLPQSSLEVQTVNGEEAQILLDKAMHLLGRHNLIEIPVAQDEVFGVLRRRLFSSWGTEDEINKVVRAFMKYYKQYANFFPEHMSETKYRDRLLAAYPFHPELIDLMYRKWGPHPKFQRTRGALRLLAYVISNLWHSRTGSAYLIQPWCVDLSNRTIRGEIVQIPGETYNIVIENDVLNKGLEIDRELKGEYYRERLATGAATSIFLHSISAVKEQEGASEPEIRGALLRPGINPTMVSEVLSRLREKLWYLRYRDRKYVFTSQVSWRGQVSQREQVFAGPEYEERVLEEIRGILKKVTGSPAIKMSLFLAPQNPEQIEDRPVPTLVLLPPELPEKEQIGWMERALNSHRTGWRTHKNTMIFVAPITSEISKVKAQVYRLMALRDFMETRDFNAMDSEEKKEVQQELRNQEEKVRETLKKAYTKIYRPQKPEGLRKIRESRKDAVQARTISEYVISVLKAENLLIDKLAPEFLVGVLFGSEKNIEKREVSFESIRDLFWNQPGQPLITGEDVIREALNEGAKKGIFQVKTRSKEEEGARSGEITSAEIESVIVVSPGAEPQVTPEKEEIGETEGGPTVLEMSVSTLMSYPITQVLQMISGTDAKVHVKITTSRPLSSDIRSKIESLLTQYKVSFEWKEEGNGGENRP